MDPCQDLVSAYYYYHDKYQQIYYILTYAIDSNPIPICSYKHRCSIFNPFHLHSRNCNHQSFQLSIDIIIKIIIYFTRVMKVDDKLLSKQQTFVLWVYTFRFEICKVMALLSAIYLLLSLFQIKVLIAFAILFSSLFGIFYFRWRNIRERGIINYVSPSTKDVLLKRSLFDVFRDQIYFPYFTKIIGLFIKAAITKPDPQQLQKMFEKLPEKVRNAINTKGILHLAPSKVQQLVLQRQPDVIAELEIMSEQKPKTQQIVLSKSYGTVNPMWDKRLEYEAQQVKIHEHTISKELIWKISEKLKWGHIIALTVLLATIVKKTRGKKLSKIFIYNGSFFGIIALFVLVVIKYKQPLKHYKEKLQKIGK